MYHNETKESKFVTFVPKDDKDSLRITMPVRDIDLLTEDVNGRYWIIRSELRAQSFGDKYIELSKAEYVSVMKQLGFVQTEG